MLTRKRLLAAALMGVQKDSPTPSQVHVDTPDWKPDKKRRRRAAQLLKGLREFVEPSSADISKDDKPGMYVGRRVLNGDQLQQWWMTQARPGEPSQLDANPHITVAYSRVDFPWVNDPCGIIVPPECLTGMKILGPDNALVLRMESPLLQARWQSALDAGASWDHDGYQPHVSLFYFGAGFSAHEWRDGFGSRDWRDATDPHAPAFPIVLGPELSGPRGTDVFAPAAPDWYTAPA